MSYLCRYVLSDTCVIDTKIGHQASDLEKSINKTLIKLLARGNELTVYAKKLTYEQANDIIQAMLQFRFIAGPDGHDIISSSDLAFFNSIMNRIRAKIVKACPEMIYGTPENEIYLSKQHDLLNAQLKEID